MRIETHDELLRAKVDLDDLKYRLECLKEDNSGGDDQYYMNAAIKELKSAIGIANITLKQH